ESVEMLAERARAMLLKRADEQLRRIVSGEKPAPLAGVPSVASQVAVAEADRSVVEPLRVTIAGGAGAGRAEQVRSFFGARNTRSGVLFVQPLTIGTWVAIAGDFNEWTPSKSVMRRNEELGVFELCVPLAP